jgi:hypothetical protein
MMLMVDAEFDSRHNNNILSVRDTTFAKGGSFLNNKITLSVIKADIGGFVGHSSVRPELLAKANECLEEAKFLEDYYVTHVGDDLNLIMTHRLGEENAEVHQLAWNTFLACTEIAKEMKLYGAGQDLLSDAFSGNVKGMGPGVAEMEFEERKSEPVIVFAADKTELGHGTSRCTKCLQIPSIQSVSLLTRTCMMVSSLKSMICAKTKKLSSHFQKNFMTCWYLSEHPEGLSSSQYTRKMVQLRQLPAHRSLISLQEDMLARMTRFVLLDAKADCRLLGKPLSPLQILTWFPVGCAVPTVDR